MQITEREYNILIDALTIYYIKISHKKKTKEEAGKLLGAMLQNKNYPESMRLDIEEEIPFN